MQLFVREFDELTVSELYDILALRSEVFVVEQKCAYQDPDDLDRNALHVWFEDSGKISAYLRILPAGLLYDDVTIGRVITVVRGVGTGRKLVAEGVRIAEERFGPCKIVVAAQVYARAFYEKCGFRQISDEFSEDGIPHVMMVK